MRRINWIAMDVHSRFCEGGCVDDRGKPRDAWKIPTTIPSMVEVIGRVPGPRVLVIEEGPLADWIARELDEYVDQVIVAEPRRNALIAKEGEKDDAIDWRKLADLARGGYIKPVHQSRGLERSVFKQHVQLYHQQVSQRVRQGLRVVWKLRRFGVVICEAELIEALCRRSSRIKLLERLPASGLLRADVRLMLKSYEQAAENEDELRKRLVKQARQDELICRLKELPGVKWIRAATFVAVIDTPFRFKSRSALWKYMGIGLERRRSGDGPVRLGVCLRCNRLLKSTVLGAAKTAIRVKQEGSDNEFAAAYRRWIDAGSSPRIARRNVARAMSAIMWGMMKTGSEYDPNRSEHRSCAMQG